MLLQRQVRVAHGRDGIGAGFEDDHGMHPLAVSGLVAHHR